jgi:hypothetical protein
VSVDVTTQDGTALAPGDYDPTSATITFAPGETAHTFDVLVEGDAIVEANETFTVVLSNAVGAPVSVGTGTGTILDDELPASPPPNAGNPTLRVDDVSVAEGDHGTAVATFHVTLSSPSSARVTFHYATHDGSALAPSDYRARVGNLTIPSRVTSRSIDVPIIGDTKGEPDETFTLDLTNVVGADVADGSGTGTIVNDDRFATRMTLRAKGRRRHILSRGRLVGAEKGMRIRVVLLRRDGGGFVRITRATVNIRVRQRGGRPVGIFRVSFHHEPRGHYVVRAFFRGDATHLPGRGHAHIHL